MLIIFNSELLVKKFVVHAQLV